MLNNQLQLSAFPHKYYGDVYFLFFYCEPKTLFYFGSDGSGLAVAESGGSRKGSGSWTPPFLHSVLLNKDIWFEPPFIIFDYLRTLHVYSIFRIITTVVQNGRSRPLEFGEGKVKGVQICFSGGVFIFTCCLGWLVILIEI